MRVLHGWRRSLGGRRGRVLDSDEFATSDRSESWKAVARRFSADCEPGVSMSTMRWHTMMSVDGFVAGPNDDMSWAFDADLGDGEVLGEVVAATGSLLVGSRTQGVEDREQPGFYGGAFRGPFFVLRHGPHGPPPVVNGVTGVFLDVEVAEAVRIARAAAGGGDVGVLGADVARQCLAAGLIEEILVHVVPVLLGDGVRFLERPGGGLQRLRPVSTTVEGHTTALRFSVDAD